MIEFKPFKGVRPAKQKAAQVTSENVENYSQEEIVKEIEKNPESFLNIVKPIVVDNLSDEEKVTAKVRHNFEDFMSDEILLTDRKSYYIYEQENNNEQIIIGIIGVISIDDFVAGKIKPHEDTIEKKEKIFDEFLNSAHFQSDPILLTFPENQSIELIMSMTTRHSPTLEFTGRDNHTHRLWQVKDRLVVKQLKTAIEKLEAFYIADGHHRMVSAKRYTDKAREEEPDFFGGEAFNYAMAILVPDNHLKIYDYNRLVKDLNELSKEEFIEKLSTVFTVVEKGDEPYFPSHKHHISMYLEGEFYSLYVNQEYRGIPTGLGELDTYLLEEHVLKPILNIQNSRTNDRLKFIKGTGDMDGVLKIKEKVDSGKFTIGFSFYPISPEDMRLVADEGLIMPPKSTYIEPKFLSGLTIYDLEDYL
ncbi:DUF1015 family protein [Flavobacteriaceae bacterium Ap0902]|nr:DUF1015 family protein [Flavobacteriaceae bacterium Ap0902]